MVTPVSVLALVLLMLFVLCCVKLVQVQRQVGPGWGATTKAKHWFNAGIWVAMASTTVIAAAVAASLGGSSPWLFPVVVIVAGGAQLKTLFYVGREVEVDSEGAG